MNAIAADYAHKLTNRAFYDLDAYQRRVARIRRNLDELRGRSASMYGAFIEWVGGIEWDMKAVDAHLCEVLRGVDGDDQRQDYAELRGG